MSGEAGDSTWVLGGEASPGGGQVPVLRFTTGSQAGKTIRLENGSLTLGRGSENDLVVQDRGISRVHLKLMVQGSRVHLFDQQSTNGTHVGGRRVAQATLEDGDQIVVGTNLRMRFLLLAPEEKELEQKLYEGATLDALTGVANRRSWLEQAQQALSSQLLKGKPVSLAMCDLDHFKQVNDSHGHAAGDTVLVEFCRRTRGLGREVVVGRLGGEEFAILLPGFSHERGLARMQRLRGEVESPPFTLSTEKSLAVTVSVGVVTATSPQQGRLDLLLKQADEALYAAKQAGRNRVMSASVAAGVDEASQTLPLVLQQKRRNSRTQCDADVWFSVQGQDYAGQLRDIGVGGLSMTVTQALALEESVEVRLRSHPESVVRAVVKWILGSEVGLLFADPPDQLRSSWVNQLLKQLGRTADSARERRRYARLQANTPMTLSAPLGTYSARLVNLGLGGLCADSALAPPVGLVGQLELADLRVQVQVMWVKAPRFGLKFAPLSKPETAQLLHMVKELTRPL